jgi:hypothetical protein
VGDAKSHKVLLEQEKPQVGDGAAMPYQSLMGRQCLLLCTLMAFG